LNSVHLLVKKEIECRYLIQALLTLVKKMQYTDIGI